MDKLPELREQLNKLDISNYEITQYNGEGIQIRIIPNQIIYLNYQAHQIQIDPKIEYILSVNSASNLVQIGRDGVDAIDLPTKQIKPAWTTLLYTLLSVSKQLVRDERHYCLQQWEQQLELAIKSIQGAIAYNTDLSAQGLEIGIEREEGSYYFRWDSNGNLHEEGTNSGEWNYNNLEFLNIGRQLNDVLPSLKIEPDSDDI